MSFSADKVAIQLNEIDAIEWITIVLLCISMIIVTYTLFNILYSKWIRNSKYRILLSLFLAILILGQGIIGKYFQYFGGSGMLRIAIFTLAILQLFFFGINSTSVLELYQSLIPSITLAKINLLRGIIFTISVFNAAFLVVEKSMTNPPDWVVFLSIPFFMIYMLCLVIYDEAQNIYLIVQVYRSTKTKVAQTFQKLLFLNIFMIVLDMVGFVCLVFTLFSDDHGARIAYNISSTVQAAHGVILVYLFAGLIELKFVNRKVIVKLQPIDNDTVKGN